MKQELKEAIKMEWIIIIITYKIVAAAVVVKYDFELF